MKRLLNLGLALALAALLSTGCTYERKTTTAAAPSEPAKTSSWPGSYSDGRMWTAMAFPTGKAATSVVGIEKGMPGEVRLGEPFTYKIKATNLTGQGLNNVVITDKPGDNFRLDSSTPAATKAGDGSLSWNLGDLKAGESRTIEVTGSAASEGTVAICTTVSYMPTLCASTVVTQPELMIAKAGPAEVLKCDPITYRYTVSNPGSGSVSGVSVTDKLASGLTTMDGQGTVTFDVGLLEPGQTRAFEVKVKADKAGTYASGARVASGSLAATADEVRTVVREPMLSVKLTGTAEQYIGRTSDYTVVVTNTGDGVARDAVLEVAVAGGGRITQASDGATATDGKLTYSLGDLAPKGSFTARLVYSNGQPGTVKAAATARAYCAAAASDMASTEYVGIPAILLEVVDVDDPVAVGTNTTYVITATNQGSAPATGVAITAQLEESMQFVAAAGATTGSAAGNKITFQPLPTLGVGQKATWQLTAKAVEADDHRIRVTMTSDQLQRPVEETEATNLYE